MSIPKILVIHALQENSRHTNVEFTCMFARHGSGVEVHYQNIFGIRAACTNPKENYDFAVISYEVLAHREWAFWPDLVRRIKRLVSTSSSVLMFPQDDYTYSFRLDELAVDLGATIYSPITKDLKNIYPRSIADDISLRSCLTGYLEPKLIDYYSQFRRPMADREIVLGQRVSRLPLSFGTLGRRKAVIAETLQQEFREAQISTDVSTQPEDALGGTEWLAFLGNCRTTVSRKGGASAVDSKNKVKNRLRWANLLFPFFSEEFRHKIADRGESVIGDYSAESPRLFEAAALHVVQILEEDEYLGGALVPWEHYIPLKSDFTNVSEIIEAVQDVGRMEQIAQSAFDALIRLDKYSYEAFVSSVLADHLDPKNGPTSIHQSRQLVDLDATWGDERGSRVAALKASLESHRGPSLVMDSVLRHEYVGLHREVCKLEPLPETLLLPWRSLSN